jgi:hypothetical protein
LPAFPWVARGIDLEVGESAHNADIVHLMVGDAIRAIAESGMHAIDFDIAVGVADVDLQLFIRTGDEERGGVAGDGDEAPIG